MQYFYNILFTLSFLFTSLLFANDSFISLTREALIKTSPQQQEFIQRLPISSCGPLCVSFSSYLGVEFKVAVQSDISSPQIIFDDVSRTLILPSTQFLEI